MFTDLREEELIESVSIPTEPFPPERTGMTFLELKRAAQTFPTVSAATSIRVDDPTRGRTGRRGRPDRHGERRRYPAPRRGRRGPRRRRFPLGRGSRGGRRDRRVSGHPESEMHADRDYKEEEVAGEYAKRSLETSYERAVATEI